MALPRETCNSSCNSACFKTKLEAVFHSFKARQQISFLIVRSEGKCTFTLPLFKLTTLTWSSSAAGKSSIFSFDNISSWTQVFRDSASFPKFRDFLDAIIFSGDLTRWDFTLGDLLFWSGVRSQNNLFPASLLFAGTFSASLDGISSGFLVSSCINAYRVPKLRIFLPQGLQTRCE